MKDNMSLGEFILALKGCDPTLLVYYDFNHLVPTTFNSYRGFYEQLALGWSEDGVVTVAELLKQAEDAMGATFEGYKGGDYRMGRGTPLWCCNYGRSNPTAIVGIEKKWEAIIQTAYVDL